jgi:hypothetical protein
MRNFKNSLKRLEDSLIKKEYYKENPSKRRFSRVGFDSSIKSSLKQIEDQAWYLVPRVVNKDKAYTLLLGVGRLKHEQDLKRQLKLLQELKGLKFRVKNEKGIEIPKINVHDDVSADLIELKKCYDAGCYRSAAILAGRILEVALHKKYYDVTGRDILEKSPGIGLGKLIAKMCEKDIKLDPGLTQQIHLINQVRVFSVHKKERVFNPSKAQAHAMILYTIDVLEKLFK